MEGGGWLFLVMDVLGALVLAAALIYGTVMWRHRRKDRVTRQAQSEAVRDNYRHGG